jgi:hypothetical protein
VWSHLLAALALAGTAAALVVALGGGGEPAASPSDGSAGGGVLGIAIGVVAALVVLGLVARGVVNSLTNRAVHASRCVIITTRSLPGTAAVEVQAHDGSGSRALIAQSTDVDRPQLRELQHYLRRRRRPLPLIVPSHVAESRWEEALLLGPTADRLPRAQAWRLPPAPQRADGPRSIERRVVGMASERWLLFVESVWEGRGLSLLELGPIEKPEGGGIVHLIGVPARTSGGWRLRLDDDRLAEAEGGTVTRSADAAEQLIAAQAIATSPGPGFVIVQGSPGSSSAEAAAGLRGFAAELSVAGVPSVLTIPPLPGQFADAACKAFARALPRNATAPEDLLRASGALRSAIVRGVGGLGGDVRVALDVCLYAPERR